MLLDIMKGHFRQWSENVQPWYLFYLTLFKFTGLRAKSFLSSSCPMYGMLLAESPETQSRQIINPSLEAHGKEYLRLSVSG